jgi:hypothetical protein
MTCRDAQPHLVRLADGEWAGAAAAEIAQHVRECPACASTVRSWQALRAAAGRAVIGEPIPLGLAQRVSERLASARAAERFHRVRFGGGLAAAAALLLAIVAGLETPSATEVTAQQFTEIHQTCSLRLHDQLGVAGLSVTESQQHLRRVMPFRVCAARPDAPYQLSGACLCLRSNVVQALHLAYLSPEQRGPPLSVFSLNHAVLLRDAVAGPAEPHRRRFATASRGELNVVLWEDRQQSFALCGSQPIAELTGLAERLDVAVLLAESIRLAQAATTAPCHGAAGLRPH